MLISELCLIYLNGSVGNILFLRFLGFDIFVCVRVLLNEDFFFIFLYKNILCKVILKGVLEVC